MTEHMCACGRPFNEEQVFNKTDSRYHVCDHTAPSPSGTPSESSPTNEDTDEGLVKVAVTGYMVSRLPDTSENQSVWGLRVEATGDGKWAVRRHRMCLGRDGVWEYELSPSERDDEWLAFYRWNSAEDAIAAAVKAEPHIIVNGLTAEDVRQQELAQNNKCPDCGHPSDQQPGHRLECPTITSVPPRLRLVTDELGESDG